MVSYLERLTPVDTHADAVQQRFNIQGLTGCLTIYESLIIRVNIEVQNSSCEDAVNIVRSNGSIDRLNVSNAISDAVDFDFSDLRLDTVNVVDAQNDCFDVSGGDYKIGTFISHSCGDKSLSIGEESEFYCIDCKIQKAEIALAVKDYSNAKIVNLIASDINSCVELYQKKQEFGGAKASVSYLECFGSNTVDERSVLETNYK